MPDPIRSDSIMAMLPTRHAARPVAPLAPPTWRPWHPRGPRGAGAYHRGSSSADGRPRVPVMKITYRDPERSRSRSPTTSRQQQQRELSQLGVSCVKKCEQLAAVAELERQAMAMLDEARSRRRRLEQDIAEEHGPTPSDDLA